MSDPAASTTGAKAPTGPPQTIVQDGPIPLTIWLGFLAMALGNFMSILDIQIVASSLREIQAGVSASTDEIAWVQTAYLIAEVIAIPLTGYLGRALSIRRLFVFAGIAFVVTSILCATAWTLQQLIVYRAMQGFAGGMLMPTTMAAIFLIFPRSRQVIPGLLVGLVSTTAPSIGPTLGGTITEHFGWRWMFLINIPPGLVMCYLVWRFSPLRRSEPELLGKIDWVGVTALALWLGSLEYVLHDGPKMGWLTDPHLVLWLLASIAASLVFFWRSFTVRVPVVQLGALRNRNFAAGSLVAFVIGIGLYGPIYLQPLFLSAIRGFNAEQIGHAMFAQGAAMFLSAPILNRVVRKFDLRLVLIVGILAISASCFWQAAVITSEAGLVEFLGPQALRGFGFMCSFMPMTQLALGTLTPQEVQNSSGLFNLNRNLGGALGLAVITSVYNHGIAIHIASIAASLLPGDPRVDLMLQQARDQAVTQGVANVDAFALMKLVQAVDRQAMIATFQDLFVWLGVLFLATAFLTVLMDKPPPMDQSPPDR